MASYSKSINLIKVADGQSGQPGTTIVTSSVAYQIGNNGTTPPTGEWKSEVQDTSNDQGKYLWAKTEVQYSDGRSIVSYSVSYIASDGSPGTSITGSTIWYICSSNGTTPPDLEGVELDVEEGQLTLTPTSFKVTNGSLYAFQNGHELLLRNESSLITGIEEWSSSIPEVPNGYYLWIKTVTTYSNADTTVFYAVSKNGQDGAPGASARGIVITGEQAFRENEAGAYTPDKITLTASIQGDNLGFNQWLYKDINGEFQPFNPAEKNMTIEVTPDMLNIWNNNMATIKAESSDPDYKDVISLYKISDGSSPYLVYLTNENITYSANSIGKVAAKTNIIKVIGFRGETQIEPILGNLKELACPEGMSVVRIDNSTFTVAVEEGTKLGSENQISGTIGIPVTFPIETTLEINWTKVNNGQDGRGIEKTDVAYKIGDNGTKPPEDENAWSEEMPDLNDYKEKYLWTKITTHYSSGEPLVNYTAVYIGKDGEQGPPGLGYRLDCDQTEILKFTDFEGKVTISPSILRVTVFKDNPSELEGSTQITDLDLDKFSVQILNLNTGVWYPVDNSEGNIIELDNILNKFNINLETLVGKGTEEGNLAANILMTRETIIKINYGIHLKNDDGTTGHFNIVEYLNVRYGMNKDMASLSVKAEGIVAAMQDSKMIFDINGLTIQNGAFVIQDEDGDDLLYSEDGNLALKGTIYAESGYFKGKLEAASGTFAGELKAASGTFTGKLEAASGTFAGDISAASGTIGGFKIEGQELRSTDSKTNPNIVLNGGTGQIIAENIVLGTGAQIREYIKIGDQVELRRVINPTDSFIRVLDDKIEIFALKADGTMNIGNGVNTIILSGSDGSIMSQNYTNGLGWKISNTESIFNDVTVRGSIRASVLEYGETQAIGGALVVRPSSRILECTLEDSKTILTLEEIKGFNENDYCRIDVQSLNSLEHRYYKILSVNEEVKQITVEGDASGSQGKPIVDFGQTNDNVGICINGSIDNSFGTPQSISVFDFNPDTKIISPRIVLGKLPNEESIYGYAAGTYGLYAENVLLKGSLVTQAQTGDNGVMYSGISTVYTGEGVPRSIKLSEKMPSHIPGEILLWAGAEDTDKKSIENSKFFVDRNGNMYAGSGYFEGTIITNATITASAIETATLRGTGNTPALTIEDAKNGIHFTTFEDNLLPIEKDSWEEGFHSVITKNFISVQEFERYSLTFGSGINTVKVYFYNDGQILLSTQQSDIKNFASFTMPKETAYVKIEIQGYETFDAFVGDLESGNLPSLRKYKTVFEVTENSVVANVPNFNFNSNFTVSNNGSLVVPNLYVIGSDDGAATANETATEAIVFDKRKISYIRNFLQSELKGNISGYIDFSNNLVFSPDGTNQVLTLSAQQIRANMPLYIQESIRYNEIMEYTPAYEEDKLVGYDLYIE